MAGINTPMDVPNVPSATSTPKGVFDVNPAPGLTKPRSPGGIPVKFFEEIAAAPGAINTAADSAIQMSGGPGGGGHKPGPALDTPMSALD